MRGILAEQCKNCRNAFQAFGLAQPILICNHKKGCEGKSYVVSSEDYCLNFKFKREIHRPQKLLTADSDDVRFIPLTQGKFAIVDDDDYDWLVKYKWHCRKAKNHFYAFRAAGCNIVAMHRQIMNAPKSLVVDHIDSNGLNNRKSNLRLCTQAQNLHNKRPQRGKIYSKYKGITWEKRTNKFRAGICKSGAAYHLGYFVDEIEAAISYDRMAEQLFGEFAYLNFPQLAEFRKFARKIIYPAPNLSCMSRIK